jgi:hypothetical protein
VVNAAQIGTGIWLLLVVIVWGLTAVAFSVILGKVLKAWRQDSAPPAESPAVDVLAELRLHQLCPGHEPYPRPDRLMECLHCGSPMGVQVAP